MPFLHSAVPGLFSLGSLYLWVEWRPDDLCAVDPDLESPRANLDETNVVPHIRANKKNAASKQVRIMLPQSKAQLRKLQQVEPQTDHGKYTGAGLKSISAPW